MTDGEKWTEISADHDETARMRFSVEPHKSDLRVAARSGAASDRLDAQLVRLRKHLLAADVDSALAEVERPKPTRGRPRRLTAWEARRAADAYRRAISPDSPTCGQDVRSAVADEFLVGENTADEYIKLARQLGFLPPAGADMKRWASSEPRQLLPKPCRCGDAYSEHDADGCERCRCGEYVAARHASEFDPGRR